MSESETETTATPVSAPASEPGTVNNDRLKQILHEIVSYLPASAEGIATNLHSLIDVVDSFEDIHETPVGVPGAGMETAPSGSPETAQIIAAIQNLGTVVQGVVADVEALKSGSGAVVATENPPAGAGGVA